ncbi:MAG: MBL fold metallo-hydrolase, partial [Gammaproteobacteria bacterium]|nr:MBL fold metallo-hydrolase [Gammaproteobacteria bacterium]
MVTPFRNLCGGLMLALFILAGGDAMARTVKGVKVTDRIYMATDMSRTFLVVTPAGNVVIDTTTRDSAPRHYQVLREMSSAPVKYILLTHAHEDHVGGVHLWKEEGT